jgi:hypothetical protein
MPKNRSIQTKLKSSTQDNNAWKTIGRPKKREQEPEATKDGNFKKADSKNTPPRDTLTKSLQHDPRTVPIPSSPNSSTDDNTKADGNFLPIKDSIIKPDRLTASKPSSEISSDELSTVERELIAAINAINSSKSLVSQSKKELPTIPLLHTKSNVTSSGEQFEISSDTATDSDVIMSEENDKKSHANKNTNIQMKIPQPQPPLPQHSPRISHLITPQAEQTTTSNPTVKKWMLLTHHSSKKTNAASPCVLIPFPGNFIRPQATPNYNYQTIIWS